MRLKLRMNKKKGLFVHAIYWSKEISKKKTTYKMYPKKQDDQLKLLSYSRTIQLIS